MKLEGRWHDLCLVCLTTATTGVVDRSTHEDCPLPNYDVISDVSATLASVLTEALIVLGIEGQAPPEAQVLDLTEDVPAANPAVLSVFLFEVIEDATVRNRPWEHAPRDMTQPPPVGYRFRKPPMPLILKYLLTPWATEPSTQHQMLGRAMQALYDNAILSGPMLEGGLADSNQALKLKMAPLTLDERSRIWYAIQRRYRLSQTYEVRVVNLDSLPEHEAAPVSSRRLDAGVDLPEPVEEPF